MVAQIYNERYRKLQKNKQIPANQTVNWIFDERLVYVLHLNVL